jgi:hypothetical protein
MANSLNNLIIMYFGNNFYLICFRLKVSGCSYLTSLRSTQHINKYIVFDKNLCFAFINLICKL